MLFVKHIVLLSTYGRMATTTLLGATKACLEQTPAATVKKTTEINSQRNQQQQQSTAAESTATEINSNRSQQQK